MLKNILQICLVIFIATTVIGRREPEITTNILESFPYNLNITPFVRVGSKLYHFGESKETWFQASLICRSLGGFLASFETQRELNELSNYLIAHYPIDRWWWLSGSDLDIEGTFFWYSTGERFTYTDWSVGQPDNNGGVEDCVHLWYKSTKYQMNDWVCSNKAYYVCEADKPKTVLLSIF